MREVVAYKQQKNSWTVTPEKWSRSLTRGGRLLQVLTVRLWLRKLWCFYRRSLMGGSRLRDVVAHGGSNVFLIGTLTYWLAIGNCRCLVTEAIIAQDTNVDLEVNSQGSKRKKKRQVKQQVDDKGYPSKFFPMTEKNKQIFHYFSVNQKRWISYSLLFQSSAQIMSWAVS